MQPGNQRAAEVPRRKTQAWGPALHSATHVGFLQASDPSSEKKGAGFSVVELLPARRDASEPTAMFRLIVQ